MALWELDEFKPPQFLGFVRTAFDSPVAGFNRARYLPNQQIDDLAFEYILGANRRPAMATILGYDSEAPIGQRAGQGERIQGELPPIKRKTRIGEKELAKFLRPRTGSADVQNALDAVYSDTVDLLDSIQARLEWLAIQGLSTDRLVYDEDGVKFSFDFGYNDAFQWDIASKTDGGGGTIPVGGAWNDYGTSTPVTDLQQLCDRIAAATGFRPTEITMSVSAMNHLLNSAQMKSLVRGTADGVSTMLLSPAEVQSVFTRYNLPNIVTYDATVTRENADGSLSQVRPLAENAAFVTPGGALGSTLLGPTAESRVLYGTRLAANAPGVWAEVYGTTEPPAEFIKAAAVAFPSIPTADKIGQLTLW